MIAGRLLVLAALAASLGCSQPRTPQAPDDADGGELTCDEKARALVLCQTALRQRCTSQGNDCESACESQGGLPANTEKETSTRGLMEATQCRENCRQTRDACLGTVVQRCPVPCP
jgi:hypothetical protein